jgi:molybdate transport system regulatory protein
MSKKTLPLAEVLGFEASDKRIDILRRIGQAGSISEAARAAGVSYKAAWQAIDTLSNLAGTPLLDRAVGGSGGGGASLTEAGKHLLWAAEQLGQSRAKALAKLGQGPGTSSGHPSRMAALGLRTSMRNQLPCIVKALKTSGPAIRVELVLSDGSPLFSRITKESAQLLDLRAGRPVLALFKATAVSVSRDGENAPGKNRLEGRITRISKAVNGGETAMAVAQDLQLVGFTSPHHGLKVKDPAVAVVDESAVAIAVV